ncbi:MAG: hypothetical protein CMJ34_07965 [Phycisphaerae bacterium]|nr:hypothetical protein [Phycisphaerae bacterium]
MLMNRGGEPGRHWDGLVNGLQGLPTWARGMHRTAEALPAASWRSSRRRASRVLERRGKGDVDPVIRVLDHHDVHALGNGHAAGGLEDE